MRPQGGFSLIEIGIVVAIIGVIATAVLVTANVQSQQTGKVTLLANIQDLTTAAREFKKRYSYFPGDLPMAGTYMTGGGEISTGCRENAAGGTTGPGGITGDGIVNTEVESNCALEHLIRAGMLRGIDYDKTLGRYAISLKSWGSGPVTVSLWFDANVNAVRVTDLPCEVALEIDRKLDSAASGSAPFNEGSVRASTPNCTRGDPATDPVPTLLIRY